MAFLTVILLGRNTPEIPLRDLMAMLRLSPPFFSGALLALMFLVPPAHAQVPAAQPADEFYWSVSAAPRTITLGFGAEPGSEQAAVRFVCSRRDAFIAVNLSRNLNGAALERLKRIAGGEIAVTAQVERARFSYRGPVVEADDPSLPITVVLRARRDDPLMAALRGGKRLRFSWPQGVIEVTLENFTEVEPEWQQRCDRLAAGRLAPMKRRRRMAGCLRPLARRRPVAIRHRARAGSRLPGHPPRPLAMRMFLARRLVCPACRCKSRRRSLIGKAARAPRTSHLKIPAAWGIWPMPNAGA